MGVERRNPISTPLSSPLLEGLEGLGPCARTADEAVRPGVRPGVRVEATDAASEELRLGVGGRAVVTRAPRRAHPRGGDEPLDDERVTRRVLARAGLSVPAGVEVVAGGVPDPGGASALLAAAGPAHVVIEVDERPGPADQEPRPTAQRLLDLLLPEDRH